MFLNLKWFEFQLEVDLRRKHHHKVTYVIDARCLVCSFSKKVDFMIGL